MASWSISDDKQKELLELAQAWGKVVARRACESQPLKADTHITPMEDVAFKLAKRSPRVCCKPCWSSTPSNFLPRSLAPLAKRRARSNASHGCCICVAAASSNTMNRSVNARPVGEPFSPSRLELGLDNHSYTPTVLANIVFAGGDAKSFGKGEAYLRVHVHCSGRCRGYPGLGWGAARAA